MSPRLSGHNGYRVLRGRQLGRGRGDERLSAGLRLDEVLRSRDALISRQVGYDRY